MQLAARERGLQHVGRVGGTLGRARADDRMELVDEEDDLPVRFRDLAQDGLEAIFELAAVFRAGNQRADVEGDDAPVLQRLGHVAGDHALGEPLGDRGLADAGLADQDGVVLAPPRQDLDDAPDLLATADHGIELPESGALGQVRSELFERLVFGLGILVRNARLTPNRRQGLEQAVRRGARPAQDPPDRVVRILRHGQQQVFRRDVLVLHPLRFLERGLEDAVQAGGQLGLGAARHLRNLFQDLLDLAAEAVE